MSTPHAVPTARPLLVTADPGALEDLLRVAATAGVEVDVAPDLPAARRTWGAAPFVVVAADLARALAAAPLPRRPDVVLLGRDLDDAAVWQWAVTIGAEHVVFLPDAEQWLVDALADASEGGGQGTVVAVLGGRGGAGATSLACALAVAGERRGDRVLLVDGDRLGGGIDLVFGGEDTPGLRWPDLGGSRGRLPAAALSDALPQLAGVSVLSWDRRSDEVEVPVTSVISAGQRSHELVVVDVPRHLDQIGRHALGLAAVGLVVVPAGVRAVAAAGRVCAAAAELCDDLRVVVRLPGPAGLSAADVGRVLGLPVAGELRPESGLDVALERGEPPGRRSRSPLAGFCDGFLAQLLSVRRAA